MIYHSKFFGEINLKPLKNEWWTYDAEVDLYNNKIGLDLNTVSSKSINPELINKVDSFLEDLENQEHKIRSFLKKDFENSGIAKEFIDIYIEFYEGEFIEPLIKNSDRSLSIKERLYSIIYLHRIGFYPEEDDDVFAVFDYTIGRDITDQLLVVNVLNNMSYSITIES